jgi:hypothetical protein
MANRIILHRILVVATFTLLVSIFGQQLDASEQDLRVDIFKASTRAVCESDSYVWVATREGLYRWSKPLTSEAQLVWTPPPVKPDRELVEIRKILQIQSSLWIGTTVGLFRWEAPWVGEPQHVGPFTNFVDGLTVSGTTLWIGTSNGIFRWDAPQSGAPVLALPFSVNGDLQFKGGNMWIATDLRSAIPRLNQSDVRSAVYTWSMSPNDQPLEILTTQDHIWCIAKTTAGLFFTTDSGLYRNSYPVTGQPEKISFTNEKLFGFYALEVSESRMWIGTIDGLFRLEGFDNSPWDMGLKITNRLPSTIYPDTPVQLVWTYVHTAWRATDRLIKFQIVLAQSGHAPQYYDVPAGRLEYTIPSLPSGNYAITVRAFSLGGTPSVPALDRQFTVYRSAQDIALQYLKLAGLWYSVASITLFLILVAGAKKSKRCFEILIHPATRKLGVYFGIALEQVPLVRLWVFERYFANLKRAVLEGDRHEYVATPMKDPRGGNLLTTDMLKELSARRRLWVHGLPGTGKTEMVHDIVDRYCQETSLFAAWKKYHFIPIVVPLRDFGTLEVPDAAMAVLASYAMPFDDVPFFVRLLRSGAFLLFLDGQNEVSLGKSLRTFAASTPDIRLAITSQEPPYSWDIPDYQILPWSSKEAVLLLRAFLGSQQDETFDGLNAELLVEIQTGYDVELLADVIRAGEKVPQNRVQLYDRAIERAARSSGDGYPVSVLYRTAWTLWKSGQRRFKVDSELTEEMAGPLKKGNIVVEKADELQFRHDLMRSYLAACWLVLESPTPEELIRRLTDEEVWALGASEQDEVFVFLGELVDSAETLRQIAQFAATNVGTRIRLLIAVKDAAGRRSLPIQLSL